MSNVETNPIDDEEQNDEKYSLSLLDMPVEIILHICSFLDASTLVHGLSLVCKHFYEILVDNSLWKGRINQMCPNTRYPILQHDDVDKLFWKLSCTSIERQMKLWKNDNAIEKLSLTNVQYSTIDGLLLMHNGKTCISGARDRTLVYWSLPSKEDEGKTDSVNYAHDGWIWDLTSIDDTVYSCSWDQSIRAWTVNNAGLTYFKTYEMIVSGALLCVASCPELALFATGSFCKTILVFDARSGRSPIALYQPHHRAVIRLAMNSDYILSASEDKTVTVYDHRAGRILKNVTISKDSFPMSICMQNDKVYVGDSAAKLHVLDPKNNFQSVKCYTTDHTKGITGVKASDGCIITSSKDKTVRISYPTDPPTHLTTLSCKYGEIASIDYLNEVLAVSGTEGIEIWRPKFKF